MIKAITFDLDGVYFPDGKAKFISALENHGVTSEDVRRVFLNSPEMNEKYKLGLMSDEQYWTWAANEWANDLDSSTLIQLLIDSYTVDEKVAEFVRMIRQHGYKTLICSNNFPARVNGLQAKFGFLDDFDAAVFSFEVGATKPSTEIFNALIEQSGAEASEIIYSDDDVTKLAGALELGINAFTYEDFEQFVAEIRELGIEL